MSFVMRGNRMGGGIFSSGCLKNKNPVTIINGNTSASQAQILQFPMTKQSALYARATNKVSCVSNRKTSNPRSCVTIITGIAKNSINFPCGDSKSILIFFSF